MQNYRSTDAATGSGILLLKVTHFLLYEDSYSLYLIIYLINSVARMRRTHKNTNNFLHVYVCGPVDIHLLIPLRTK